MSFAIDYLNLLHKYDKLYTNLPTVTRFFDISMKPYMVKHVCHEYERDIDYDENVCPSVEYEGDTYEADNYTLTLKCNEESFNDINKMFEDFLNEVFYNPPIEIYSKLQLYDLDFLLGCFHLSVINSLLSVASKEYAALKDKYPNESYYPVLSLIAKEEVFYESSKCW